MDRTKVPKKVSFNLEDNETTQETTSATSSKPRRPFVGMLGRRPAFSTQRLFKSLASSSDSSMTIKEKHSIDLDKLSLEELNDLFQKQQKLINNKSLLSKLKDKGEKIVNFQNQIKKHIELKKEIESTEKMLNNLSIESDKVLPPNSETFRVSNKLKILEKNSQCSMPHNRFNLPKSYESKLKFKNSQIEKDVLIKIDLPKEIKTINLEDSIKTLELTTLKEKDVLKDQMLRFYTYRTRDNEYSDEDSSDYDDNESDMSSDDSDMNVNVCSLDC